MQPQIDSKKGKHIRSKRNGETDREREREKDQMKQKNGDVVLPLLLFGSPFVYIQSAFICVWGEIAMWGRAGTAFVIILYVRVFFCIYFAGVDAA